MTERAKPLIFRIETDEDLCSALRTARAVRRETQEDVEHRVGLTQGHLGKIEHGGKTWGKRVLRMTMPLKWLLEHYGLTLMIVDQTTAAALTGPVIQHHVRTHMHKPTRTVHPNAFRLAMRLVRRPE